MDPESYPQWGSEFATPRIQQVESPCGPAVVRRQPGNDFYALLPAASTDPMADMDPWYRLQVATQTWETPLNHTQPIHTIGEALHIIYPNKSVANLQYDLADTVNRSSGTTLAHDGFPLPGYSCEGLAYDVVDIPPLADKVLTQYYAQMPSHRSIHEAIDGENAKTTQDALSILAVALAGTVGMLYVYNKFHIVFQIASALAAKRKS